MQSPPPPSQQQAEEAQRARHAAELAVLALFASSERGGGSGEGESSSLDAVKISVVLGVLTAAIINSSFRHPRDSSRRLLASEPDKDEIVRAALPGAQRAFERLRVAELSDEQRAVLWATQAHSEVTNIVAQAVNEDYLAQEELLSTPLRKVWISRSDRRVRPLHAKLHGKVVSVQSDFWRWPQTGQRLRWPGDRDAPMDATMGCRCVSILTWADQGAVSDTIRKIVDYTDPTG